MSGLETIEALTLVLYLLPGVWGFFIYEMLAEGKPSELSTKVMAIVSLTFVSVLISKVIFGTAILPSVDQGDAKNVSKIFNAFFGIDFLFSFLVAGFLGFGSAWMQNFGVLLLIFKFTGVTRKTGKIDTWHQAFGTLEGKWCRVRYIDGTRLVGWPEFYSLDGESKGLFLARATWHVLAGDHYVSHDIDGPGVLLLSFDDVVAIDFMD